LLKFGASPAITPAGIAGLVPLAGGAFTGGFDGSAGIVIGWSSPGFVGDPVGFFVGEIMGVGVAVCLGVEDGV
jgi:hypothetical protein